VCFVIDTYRSPEYRKAIYNYSTFNSHKVSRPGAIHPGGFLCEEGFQPAWQQASAGDWMTYAADVAHQGSAPEP
jgi:hypothetical protein